MRSDPEHCRGRGPEGLGSHGQIPMVPGWHCWSRVRAAIPTGSADADSGAARSHARELAPTPSPQVQLSLNVCTGRFQAHLSASSSSSFLEGQH